MDPKPCEFCGEMFVPVRFATTRFCSQRCRSAQYQQDNKERLNERNAQYRQDNKERIAQYRLDNKERLAQYQQDNKERIAERMAQYYLDNKERLAKCYAQWQKKQIEINPHYRRDVKREQKRRKLKAQQEGNAA